MLYEVQRNVLHRIVGWNCWITASVHYKLHVGGSKVAEEEKRLLLR